MTRVDSAHELADHNWFAGTIQHLIDIEMVQTLERNDKTVWRLTIGGDTSILKILEQSRTNRNHLTGMILPSHLSQVREERNPWRCIASAKACDDVHASKAPGLRWVKSVPRGRCGPCPMQRHRTAHRA